MYILSTAISIKKNRILFYNLKIQSVQDKAKTHKKVTMRVERGIIMLYKAKHFAILNLPLETLPEIET